MSKIKIYGKADKKHQDSFWFDGLIAETKHFKLLAVGDIMIYQSDKSGRVIGQHNGFKSYDNFDLKLKNDKDLEKIGNDFSDKYRWENNNWFSIIGDDGSEDVIDYYDDAIKTLKYYEKNYEHTRT